MEAGHEGGLTLINGPVSVSVVTLVTGHILTGLTGTWQDLTRILAQSEYEYWPH